MASDRPHESLRALQERFWRLMVHPTGVADGRRAIGADDPEGVPLTNWLGFEDENTAVERLDVYANMYFFRLRDILADDFEYTHHLIGPERFHNLATDYLLACPSNDPNVRNVSARLPTFLEKHALLESWPYLADLARLEWGRLSVFDQADDAQLAEEDLMGLPPEEWTQMVLHPISASNLLELAYPVHEIIKSVDLEAPEPRANPELERKPTTILAWRRGFGIRFRTVEPQEAAALKALREGASFSTICAHFVKDDNDLAGAAQSAHATLLRWIGEGLICRAPTKEKKE